MEMVADDDPKLCVGHVEALAWPAVALQHQLRVAGNQPAAGNSILVGVFSADEVNVHTDTTAEFLLAFLE